VFTSKAGELGMQFFKSHTQRDLVVLGSVRGRPDREHDPVEPGDSPHSWYG
jgi:hypothetical protein